MQPTYKFFSRSWAWAAFLLIAVGQIATSTAQEKPEKPAQEAHEAMQKAERTFERARQKLKLSQSPTEENKEMLLGEARELYAEARQAFLGLRDDLRIKLASLPKTLNLPKQEDLAQLQFQWRAEYLQASFYAVTILEESADAMDKSSEAYRETLEKAAAEYGELAEKYRTRLVAMYARLGQVRVTKKQGKVPDALRICEDLLEVLPEMPQEFRDIRTKALLLLIECWTEDSQKDFAKAILRGRTWIEAATVKESRSNDFMELRIAVARAALKYADQLKKENADDPKIKSLFEETRPLVQLAADHEGPFQQAARDLLATFEQAP